MKVRLGLVAACMSIGTLFGAAAAQAASVNLTTDFSNSANPNGDWSYTYIGGDLPHQGAPLANTNHLIPAIPAGGFFSTGNDLDNDNPFVFKAAVDGSAAGLTDADFLTGDVVVHSPNDHSSMSIVWTAPSAGTITNLSASTWYAHSAATVPRSNDVSLELAGSLLANWTVSSLDNTGRDDRGAFSEVGPYAVFAGDLLTLTFQKTIGQSWGSLNGAAMSFDFQSTVPVPAALPLFATALAGLGWFGHRRRKQAA